MADISGQNLSSLSLKTTPESIPVREMQSENETGVSSKDDREKKTDLDPQTRMNAFKNVYTANEEEGAATERLPETVENIPMDQIPRIIRRRIPSPVFIPPFNYTDKAFFGGLILVTVLAFATRLYKLGEPTHIA